MMKLSFLLFATMMLSCNNSKDNNELKYKVYEGLYRLDAKTSAISMAKIDGYTSLIEHNEDWLQTTDVCQ